MAQPQPRFWSGLQVGDEVAVEPSKVKVAGR